MIIKLKNMDVVDIELDGNSNLITIMNYNGIPIMSDLTNNKKTELKNLK